MFGYSGFLLVFFKPNFKPVFYFMCIKKKASVWISTVMNQYFSACLIYLLIYLFELDLPHTSCKWHSFSFQLPQGVAKHIAPILFIFFYTTIITLNNHHYTLIHSLAMFSWGCRKERKQNSLTSFKVYIKATECKIWHYLFSHLCSCQYDSKCCNWKYLATVLQILVLFAISRRAWHKSSILSLMVQHSEMTWKCWGIVLTFSELLITTFFWLGIFFRFYCQGLSLVSSLYSSLPLCLVLSTRSEVSLQTPVSLLMPIFFCDSLLHYIHAVFQSSEMMGNGYDLKY